MQYRSVLGHDLRLSLTPKRPGIRGGDKFYRCRTCLHLFADAQRLCQICYDEELAKHKKTHQFLQIHVRLIDHSEDSLARQQQQLWSCTFCKDVQWAKMPLHHEHNCPFYNVLFYNVGPAIQDELRLSLVRNGCSRRGTRSPGIERQEETTICFTCDRQLDFGDGNGICLPCMWFFCRACMKYKGSRDYHRHHQADQLRVTRSRCKVNRPSNVWRVECQTCGKMYDFGNFAGLKCCKEYYHCMECHDSGKKAQRDHDPCTHAKRARGGSAWELILRAL